MNQFKNEEHLYTDVLVIGGGMAGLFAAIKARQQGLDVILTDKAYVGRSGGTHYAEGDIQFFRLQNGDKMEDWLNFISNGNEYINNREWNEIVLSEVEDRYNDLIEWGIEFQEEDGELKIDGPHFFSNTAPLYKIISMKNKTYAPSLRRTAQEFGVRVYDRIMTCELMKQDGKVVGAAGFHTTSGKLYVFNAKATIIATGSGTAYKARAMNTDYWTGDGECMAYRAGAEIAGKEFRHLNTTGPTAAAFEKSKEIYDGGAIKGRIIDTAQKYPYTTVQSGWFWPNFNAENEPTLWTGSWDVHCGKLPLYYDLDNMPDRLAEHHKAYFKRVGSAEPDKLGLDFFNGGKLAYPSARTELNSPVGGSGIWPVDKYCASNVPGLFSAGASCATMVSGAKYGGMGMGLSAGMVTGTRAAQGAAKYISTLENIQLREETVNRAIENVLYPIARRGGFTPAWLTQVLQHTVVPYYILVVKHETRLNAALTLVEFMRDHLVPLLKADDPHDWRLAHETRNMVLNAEMTLRASLFRTESRGSHYREDYPNRKDPEWLAWTKLYDRDGHMELKKEPMPKSMWPDLSKPYNRRYPVPLPQEDR